MQAIDRELLSVLGDSTIRFVVPVYQRSYAWQKEHWERLWDDILAIAGEQDKEHFTGSIVWVGRMQGPGVNADGNILVDGQQRLTTLSLLILAYAEFAKEHDNKGNDGKELPVSFEEIIGSGYLFSSYKKGEQRYKITLSDVDKETFRALVDRLESPHTPLPETNSRLLEALEYFETRISGLEDQSALWRGLQRLRIVNVTLDPHRDNPQLVFESMNSTGKPLCHADLIRNYILLGLPIDQQTEFYHNYWRQIEIVLGTDKNMEVFDQFIFHYLTIYTSPNIVNQSEVYQIFKNYKNVCEKCVEELLQEMLFYARIYASITIEDFEKDVEIRSICKNIFTLKAAPVIPLIMLFYSKMKILPEKLTREEFIASIKYIEIYLVYRTLCEYRSNGLNRYIPSLISKFKKCFDSGDYNVSKHILATFEDERGTAREFPAKKHLIEVLEKKDFYSMATFRKKFFLEQLENRLHPKNWLDISGGNYTIEHIMPQTIDNKTDWPEMLGEGYETSYNEHLHLLGNLTVTAYNSELSNLSFQKKKEAYLSSEPIALSSDILQEATWTYEKIQERTKKLAERIVNLWPRPSLTGEEVKKYSLLRRDANENTGFISIKDLLGAGVLQVNEKLISSNESIYKGFSCRINEDGFIQFDDGKIEETPSGAAKYCIKQKYGKLTNINGWKLWFVPRLNCSLSDAKSLMNHSVPEV